MIRLLKPLDYYKEKYGTELYGLNKLYLIMEKEHNRGQACRMCIPSCAAITGARAICSSAAISI